MQVSRRLGSVAWLAACALVLPGTARAAGVDEQSVNTLFRLFTDSDHVRVRSYVSDYVLPLTAQRAVNVHWNNEKVTIPAISAPAGSAEAVDAITTASRPISGNAFEDYVKVRNEVEAEYSGGPATLDYYVSSESDYLAQMVGGNVSRSLNGDQTNLQLGSSYAWDDIKPLRDSDTQQGDATKTTLHWNAVATQIVSAVTVVRVGAEINFVSGLQHNPYRNVYAGGTHVPERTPDHRQRRDLFLRVSQALPERGSLKLDYRFYGDDWGVTSHAVDTRLEQYVTRATSVRWEYRWYTQTQADFWRTEYPSTSGIGGYLTGDYRLGPLSSHLFGTSLHLDLDGLASAHPLLGRMAAWMRYERYFNSNNYSANILESGFDLRFR